MKVGVGGTCALTNREVPARAIVDLIAGKRTAEQIAQEYGVSVERVDALRGAALSAIDSSVERESRRASASQKTTKWLKAAGLFTALAATFLIMASEFGPELASLRDGARWFMHLIASVNPFYLVVLFWRGIVDYFSGCHDVPTSTCPSMTTSATPLSAIAHGFEYIYAETPDVPFKKLLMVVAFFGSWYVGARMAKSSGSSGNFLWIVPGLLGLSAICFIAQAILWLVAGSAFVVLATLAFVGGSLSLATIAVLKVAMTVSEGRKAVEITRALMKGKELEA